APTTYTFTQNFASAGTHLIKVQYFENTQGATAKVSWAANQTQTPDVTQPTASLTSPTSNQTVSGTITLSAMGSDPTISGQVTSGLKTLFVLVDGSVFASSTTGTVSKSLDTTTLSNSTHQVI